MPVHPDSKIDPWLNNYWPAFYTSLTDKENWTYNNYSGSELTFWKDSFEDMNGHFNAYKAENREPLWNDLMNAIYSNYALQQNFGVGNIDLSLYDYTQVYNFDGFGLQTLSRPEDYYSDSNTAQVGFTSARMSDDLTLLTDALVNEELEIEENILPSLVTDFRSKISKFMFEDPPANTTPVGKQQIGEYIFNTLGYKNIYTELDVTPLELPSYIST